MRILNWLKQRFRLDEQDFADELQSHLEMAARERMRDGAEARDARLAARKDLGNVTLTTADARSVWMPRWLEYVRDCAGDAGFAMRSLSKTPLFALTVIAVLAIGIGLNAAVFTMLKSMSLSPLAGVTRSAQLAVLHGETGTGREMAVSYPDYQYLRDHDRSFNGLMGSGVANTTVGRGRGSQRVFTEIVTGNYFQVLGVRTQRGRTLMPSDEAAPGRHAVAVISDGLWRRNFSADPAVLGRTVEINNYPFTIVGVADASFHGTIVSYDVDLFLPVTMVAELGLNFGPTPAASALSDPRAELLYPHGFLRPGVTLDQAAAQAGAVFAALRQTRPLTDAAQRLKVVRFWQSPYGGQTHMLPALTVLAAMGLFVLMIACANIAGLVLVRGMARRGEIALRLALGAARSRVVRLLVIENLVLALPGALLGVLLASRGIPVLVGYADWMAAPDRLFFNIEVDLLVMAFAALAGGVSALLFGLVPALRATRVDLVTVINEDASPRGAARGGLRAALVVAQVAVSLLLLVGSSLVTRSLDAARRADPGFDPHQVSAVALDLKANGYDARGGLAFYRQLLAAARSAPGVDSATLALSAPLRLLDTASSPVAVEGYAPKRGEDRGYMSNVIGPDYFRTLKVPLLAGREFEDRDEAQAAPAIIVNQTFARRFWGSAAAALGKRVRVANQPWRTVVGVAADLKYARIDEAPRPYFYLPYQQSYRAGLSLHTRGAMPMPELIDQARALVARLDPDLPIVHARPLTELIRAATIFMDLMAAMLFLFGVAGMVLAALGTYGLVSFSVEQSAREIGIRLALGATNRGVVGGFLARGLRLGVLGAALGTVAALAVARLLGSMLYGVSATDPVSYGRALAIVLGGVLLATLVPAWRASRTNALGALRHR